MPLFKVPPEILTLLRREKSFVIATHIDPDGDTLGSALALGAALEALGKKIILYNSEPIPALYNFMPGIERFICSSPDSENTLPALLVLDCNEAERAGLAKVRFKHSTVIDHHETQRTFGDVKWIEPQAAATGLMTFHILRELGAEITKDMATNLYTAIAVDTGTFRYSNTDAAALRVSAELVEAGADLSAVAENLYQAWTDGRFRLLVMALDTLEVAGDIVITHVTKEMFASTGTSPADTDNFSNFPRMMKSTKISVFFRETDDGWWKASLRSKGAVNVAKVAEAFNGGGHKNAAGFKIKADLKTVKEELLKAIHKIQDARFMIKK